MGLEGVLMALGSRTVQSRRCDRVRGVDENITNHLRLFGLKSQKQKHGDQYPHKGSAYVPK